MTKISANPATPNINIAGFTYAGVLQTLVWLMLATSFAVNIDPAPTDAFFLLAFSFALFGGLSYSVSTLPILTLLVLYNFGGLLSLTGYLADAEAVKFILISILMLLIFVFVLGYVIRCGFKAIKTFQNGWIVGAVIGSVLGIMGATDTFGTGTIFSDQGRAIALFRDPNVYATFLIYPAVVLFQGLLLGDKGWLAVRLIAFFIIQMALFLAFSRGAWINFAFSILLVIAMTFVLSNQGFVRIRIVIMTALGLLLGAAIIAALLSIPLVQEMFIERFSFSKNYDLGETGRFGNQLNSLPDLLVLPLGYGPLQFWKIHGQDPHNTFLNAFASYGWLGGTTYIGIVICSLAAGFKLVLSRTDYQRDGIVVFAVLTTLFFQGMQIDTEHWRHMFWLLGLHWGIFALSENQTLFGSVPEIDGLKGKQAGN